jgi:hypothetical protein
MASHIAAGLRPNSIDFAAFEDEGYPRNTAQNATLPAARTPKAR